MEAKPASGLSLDQVDAIDMQIGRCKALILSLHDNSSEDEISPFLFPPVLEELEKIGKLADDFRLSRARPIPLQEPAQ